MLKWYYGIVVFNRFYYLCTQKSNKTITTFYMENKIILFSNVKGGVGKSTLCSLFATYCAEKGIPTAVVDADLQQSLVRQRQREKEQAGGEVQEPWQLISLDTSDVKGVENMMENLKTIPGWILVDCPGNLNDNGLLPVFKAADAVVVPISYEDIVIDATSIFIQVFRKISDATLCFLPNRINEAEGTKAEREQRLETIKILGQLGMVAPRIKQGVAIKRFSTLYALDTCQERVVEYPFEQIINKLK